MRIGIWGAGNMGGGLGKLWAARGHEVMFAGRDLAKTQAFAQSVGHGARGGSYADAAAFGDVILLAIPWPAAEDLLQSAEAALQGKTLIDLMNAWGDTDLVPAFGHTTSLGEQVAQWVPGARVVKAFNTIYFDHLGHSEFEGYRTNTFLCGDDADAKANVAQLATDAGFDPVDCGELAVARLVEPLAFLWGQLAYNAGYGTEVSFRLVRR